MRVYSRPAPTSVSIYINTHPCVYIPPPPPPLQAFIINIYLWLRALLLTLYYLFAPTASESNLNRGEARCTFQVTLMSSCGGCASVRIDGSSATDVLRAQLPKPRCDAISAASTCARGQRHGKHSINARVLPEIISFNE